MQDKAAVLDALYCDWVISLLYASKGIKVEAD